MKLLHILPYYFPATRYGGPVASVHGLCRALVAQGAQVEVFTTNIDGPATLDVPSDRPVERDGVQVHYFPIGQPRGFFRAPALGHALAARAREFDLIHIHGLYLYHSYAASRAALRAGVPYVVSPRGMLDPYAFTGRSALKKKLYLALIENYTLDHASALHFTTQEELELAAQWKHNWPGFVVPNALDLSEFPDPGEHTRGETFLFLSRIHPKKGLDLLIPAFAQVAAARPASRARLTLAGPDEGDYLREVRRLIAAHNLDARVDIVGTLSGATKRAALASALALVLPSYSENFGMVVAEALACRTPVIISERVNLRREVEATHTGWVVPCAVAPLAQAMLAALDAPAEARARGTRGRALVEERFTWERAAQAMLTHYQAVRDVL